MLPTPAVECEDMWRVQGESGVDVMRGGSAMENREGQNFKALGTISELNVVPKIKHGPAEGVMSTLATQPLFMQCQYWKCIVGKRGGLSH